MTDGPRFDSKAAEMFVMLASRQAASATLDYRCLRFINYVDMGAS